MRCLSINFHQRTTLLGTEEVKTFFFSIINHVFTGLKISSVRNLGEFP